MGLGGNSITSPFTNSRRASSQSGIMANSSAVMSFGRASVVILSLQCEFRSIALYTISPRIRAAHDAAASCYNANRSGAAPVNILDKRESGQ